MAYEETVQLAIPNPHLSLGGRDIGPIVRLWQEVGRYFSEYELPPSETLPGRTALTLDTTDLVVELESGGSPSVDRIRQSHERGFACSVQVRIQKTSDGMPTWLLSRFFQELFLAMHLALPGSCNLFRTRYLEDSDSPWPPIDLGSMTFEGAWIVAHEDQWPPLRELSFSRVWKWLQHDPELIYSADLAFEPLQKALFALLEVGAHRKESDQDIILLIAQVLESFFADRPGGIASSLKARIEAVLGAPRKRRRWIGKFYELRSRIAHGDVPFVRPGSLLDELNPSVDELLKKYWVPAEQAVALLLAVLQDLIQSNSYGYTFSESFRRTPPR